MARAGEKACVLKVNFSNEKKKEEKLVEDATKIAEKALKEV